jgi:hypothetical protein
LNFIFGIVCLFVCVCAFSLRRESPNMILGDKPLIFEVVLSHKHNSVWGDEKMCSRRHLPREGFRRVGGGWLRDEASPNGACLAWNQHEERRPLIGQATWALGRHPLVLMLVWTRALATRLPGSIPLVRRLPSSASRRGAVPLLRPQAVADGAVRWCPRPVIPVAQAPAEGVSLQPVHRRSRWWSVIDDAVHMNDELVAE